jgi:hypothetical protein
LSSKDFNSLDHSSAAKRRIDRPPIDLSPARSLIGRHGLGGGRLSGQKPLAVGHAGLEIEIELDDAPNPARRRMRVLDLNETLVLYVPADLLKGGNGIVICKTDGDRVELA